MDPIKTRIYTVHIKNPFDDIHVKIQPLKVEDLTELVSLAMETGFWGNRELIEYVVTKGCVNEYEAEQIVANLTIFTINDIAREIWIITLKNIANIANKLFRIIGNSSQKLRIKRYKYTDLATPGLLHFISGYLANIDSDHYAKAFIQTLIVQAKTKGKTLSKKKSNKFLNDNFDIATLGYIRTVGISDNYINELPSEVFVNNKEKLYSIMALAETLDWKQYLSVLNHYNSAVSILTNRSQRMGGMQIQKDKAITFTGLAFFINLVGESSIKKEILFAFIKDVFGYKKKVLSRHYTRLVKEYQDENLKEIYQEHGKDIEEFELAYQIFIRMAKKINESEHLVNTINFHYWDLYKEVFNTDKNEQLKKISEQVDMLLIPDCLVLVEGESDRICYSKFIELCNDKDLRVNVIDCQNKNGVYQKYRQNITDDKYIGSIVTILDSDANKEHEDIKRINKGNVITSHHIYDTGTLEDLFTKEMIVSTLNILYPGNPVKPPKTSPNI
ncbi:MAG: hypothetical protein WD000_09220 [Thermodesulfobacteriota bacterium]